MPDKRYMETNQQSAAGGFTHTAKNRLDPRSSEPIVTVRALKGRCLNEGNRTLETMRPLKTTVKIARFHHCAGCIRML